MPLESETDWRLATPMGLRQEMPREKLRAKDSCLALRPESVLV